MKVAVLGATGKTGRHVVSALCNTGFEVIAVGRDAAKLAGLDNRAERRQADAGNPEQMTAALADAERVASLLHARFAEATLAALPETCQRIVLTGSLRRFTRLADDAAEAVRQGEAAFLASGRPGVMLHPSMIYGAREERNIGRILAFIRHWPRWLPLLVPLPDGGRHTVQPVFVDDMVAAVVAAVSVPTLKTGTIVVAGPEPISYRHMIKACAVAQGRRARILPIATGPLIALAELAARLGLSLPIGAAEIRRAAEDKAFDISDMRQVLGVTPRPFEEGLRLKIERGWS